MNAPPGQRASSVATLPVSRVVHTAAAASAAGERPGSTAPGGASMNRRSSGLSAEKRAATDMVGACGEDRTWRGGWEVGRGARQTKVERIPLAH